MPVIIRMAFRNLAEHKAKSLIIGVLLALGMLIMVLGNSFLDASKRGIMESFTANYTGDVIITGTADGPVSLFGVQSPGGMEETPTIPDYEKVFAHASGLPGVVASSGMASGFAIASDESNAGSSGQRGPHGGSSSEDDEDGDMMSAVMMLFGVDAANYWKLFETIEIVDGEFLKPGERGIMLASDRLPKLCKYLKRDLKVGDEILVQGMGATGMRLRSVRLVGTFKRVSEGAGPEQLTYIDIDTLRVLAGMTVGAAEDIKLGADETAMLAVDDVDSLFADDSFGAVVESTAPKSAALTDEAIGSLLGDTSARERLNQADDGAWHSILLRLDDPAKARATIAGLNAWFAAEGIDAMAGDWQKAAGPYAQSVDVLRIVFTVAIVILAVVAIIIIMNTLVVSIIERTGEIGTMRALGAGRGFVRKMFVAETVTLAVFFGLVGMVLSFVASAVINAIGFEASNQFLEILFGGKVLKTIVQPLSVVWSLAVIVIVGLVAHFYPVSVALRIQPVRAMQA